MASLEFDNMSKKKKERKGKKRKIIDLSVQDRPKIKNICLIYERETSSIIDNRWNAMKMRIKQNN